MCLSRLAGIFALFLAFAELQLVAASEHDAFQRLAPRHTAKQSYMKPQDHRRLQTSPVAELTCEQVHAEVAMEPMRVGYELVGMEDVEPEIEDLVDRVMTVASEYWAKALKVRRATAPLRADREGSGCIASPNGTQFCLDNVAPTCGLDGMKIPDRYLKARQRCGQRCYPNIACSGECRVDDGDPQRCACNVDDWDAARGNYCCQLAADQPEDCPSTCTEAGDSLFLYGSGLEGGSLCQGDCVTDPEGEGAVDEDMHVFVTVQDTTQCNQTEAAQAYNTWCVKDQCDRPIFTVMNWCKSRLSQDPSNFGNLVSTAVHELTHGMVFSSSLYQYFRAADGRPLIPRSSQDQDEFPSAVRWRCTGTSFTFPDASGNRGYVDLSPTILKNFNERGFAECQCPIGQSTFGNNCLNREAPTCVVRLVLPTVVEEARAHFGCPNLTGAELENQLPVGCQIVGSHWEQRTFNGEVMAPSEVAGGGAFMSRVTLALFNDSGWYEPVMEMADPLTKGVHWGYQLGCGFATSACISDGLSLWDRGFCVSQESLACSLDRTHVRKCGIGSLAGGAPAASFNYLSTGQVGVVTEMDYCPAYTTRLADRDCGNRSGESIYFPFQVNTMREVFSSQSRCLSSTLRGDVIVGNTQYDADPKYYDNPIPTCYNIACSVDNASYSVSMAADPPSTAAVQLGTCTSAGQLLKWASFDGAVICADPAELCQVLPPRHTLVAGQEGFPTAGPTRTTAEGATTVATVSQGNTFPTNQVILCSTVAALVANALA
eukprot:CAMPEP_0170630816 /NCGR_PEP_ID=MMETSP0224-20130122/34240_1 /TAXON_ID=285029 /ORGANISM="Togula jolla, Strain CCCM 725" /LENGTH=770 /DNA_ID=CAMNT_0010958975 /DNA_START=1 /DNA_END=2313 /DNA_ORIENTATION=+